MTTAHMPPQFINYRVEWDATKQKWEKYPCDARGFNINHLDPSQWMDYDTAASRAHWDTSQSGPYGVAFVLNGDGWFMIDLDNCRTPDGNWTSESQALFLSFNGALGEVSMSGTGLHVFGRCDPSQLLDRRNKWEGDKEFYTTGRFCALSQAGPQPIGGTYTDADWTAQLLHAIPQREFLGELPDGRDPTYTGPEDDDELIAMMLRNTGSAGAAFGLRATVADLWNADVSVLSRVYPPYSDGQSYDASSADAALMSHLAFWTGKDMPRMDRLFRRSGLMRDKYETRADYRRSTVESAARLCKQVYDRAPVGAAGAAASSDTPADRGHSFLMSIEDMKRHFEGCTYVADKHRVLMPDGVMMSPERFNAVKGGYMFPMLPDLTRPTRKAFEAFTETSVATFPKAARTTFRPELAPGLIMPDGAVNVWVPPVIDMEPGDITPFLTFIDLLLPDANDQAILLDWMRGVVQNPGLKAMWAPVVQGTEGNGKSLIGEVLMRAIGRQYTHKPKSTRLGEKFDGWVEFKLLMWVDEFYSKDRFDVLEGLKPMITDMEIPIRGMQSAEVLVHAPINWYFATNHMDAVRKSKQDRRYAVFITPHQSAAQRDAAFEPRVFFPQLWNWLRSGGFCYLAHWLHHSTPGHYNPYAGQTVAPDTSTTRLVMSVTMDPVQAEIHEAIEGGVKGFRGGWVSSWALNKLLDDKRYRLPPTRRRQILEDMGFVQHGRFGRAIMQEENSRPIIWCHPDMKSRAIEEYMNDQGY